MLGRRVTSPDNASVALVPTFGVDPRGAALFAGAVNGTMGRLGSRVVIDVHDNAWTGWVRSPQNFRGAANITGSGSGRPSVESVTYLDASRSTAGLSPTQVLLEQRAARGRR